MIQANSGFNSPNEGPKQSSNSIIWAGPEIPCIDLCKGDTISDVQFKVATELCKIIESLDLSETDLGCINDCPTCPQPDRSLKNVIRLLIEAYCSLKEKVDSMGGGGAETQRFDVNLRCLAVTDGAGNVLNDDNDTEIVQTIIDQVCASKFSIDLLTSKVEDLQEIVNAIPPPSELELPEVPSACLYGGNRDLDVAHQLLDSAFCQLRTITGMPAAIAGGMSEQQPTLFQQYGSNPNFTAAPATLGEAVANIWIVLCDVHQRVGMIESTCCKASCDDVKIGFGVVLSDSRDSATLRFTSGNGTSIPNGFVDCGSKLTVIDNYGNTAEFSITIANAASIPVELTELDLKSDYTFSLDCCMSNPDTGVQCNKCITKTIKYQDTCAYCEITNTGSTGSIIITYTETATTNSSF